MRWIRITMWNGGDLVPKKVEQIYDHLFIDKQSNYFFDKVKCYDGILDKDALPFVIKSYWMRSHALELHYHKIVSAVRAK